MSPRLKTLRKVLSPPVIKGFKPYGPKPDKQEHGPVNLLFEEYEALRLSDYDNCNHHQGSVMMGVSRPTFTRIYASALQKIAKAFVEGRQISIEGGKVYFDSDWYKCARCLSYFNNPEKESIIENCPLCSSSKIKSYDYIQEPGDGKKTNRDDICICPHCGFEQQHRFRIPCNQQACPKCNNLMMRKGTPGSKWSKKERL